MVWCLGNPKLLHLALDLTCLIRMVLQNAKTRAEDSLGPLTARPSLPLPLGSTFLIENADSFLLAPQLRYHYLIDILRARVWT